jgi:hypothetical protein
MEPIYRKAYIELDRAEERVKFYSVRRRSAAGRGVQFLRAAPWARHGPRRRETHQPTTFPAAARPPQIDEAKLLPAQRQGLPLTDSCKPLFVVYKDKVAISKIAGMNAPELEGVVFASVPPPPKDEE